MSNNFYKVALEGNAKSTVDSLRLPQFLNFDFSLPNIEYQKDIITFLDHETAKIDTLIEKQQQLIKLLKEKRQAVISHAVTKGLNPNAPMRDSGVEWLGEVPEHWVERPLKFMAQIKNGRDYKHVEVNEGEGYPVIGSGGEFTRASDFLFNGSSVLLGRKGTIDKPLYIEGAFWTVDTMYYTDIAKNTLPKYLYYCALTIPFDFYSTNTALPSMTQGDLGNHLLLYPPFEEQREIVCFIEERTAQIDKLISKAEQAIELIKERRTALISAAVTGKVDVSGSNDN
ncbi:MAG: restriction endonuclease subunit S [Ghiorsea sp.]|nr:restriction endonuclease subunit S [Ghiorsea sp.]